MIVQPKYHIDPAGYYKPAQGSPGYQDLTIDGTVKTLTVPTQTRMARFYFRGANVRVTFHGVDPSAGVGVPFYDGYEEWFSGEECRKMRFIREGSTNGEVHVIYYL